MFESNAVRSCVELHKIELRRFLDTMERFRESGVRLPRSDDPSYQSPDHLKGHVLRAARGYLTWIGQCVKRPVADVDLDSDSLSVAGKGRAFMDEVLAAWRRHLGALEDRELSPKPTCRDGASRTPSSRCSSTRWCIRCGTGSSWNG